MVCQGAPGQDSQFIRDVDISELEKVDDSLPFKWRRVSYDADKGKLEIDFPNPSWKISRGEFDEKSGILTIHVGVNLLFGIDLQVIENAEFQVEKKYIGKVRKIVYGGLDKPQRVPRGKGPKTDL